MVVGPLPISCGRSTVTVGPGPRFGLFAALAANYVRIPGLVVPITGINALSLYKIGIDRSFLREVGCIGPGDIAVITHSRRQSAVAGHDITQSRRRRHHSGKHISQGLEAISSREADPHDGIDPRVILQIAYLHGVDRVDEDNDFLEVRLRLAYNLLLFLRQGQYIAG